MDRGLPTCSGGGEAATDGARGRVHWRRVGSGDVLREVLQLEEGEGVRSPWKGIGGVGGSKCGEERQRFDH
jgi:hypothetical protein